MVNGDGRRWTAELRRRDSLFLRCVMKVWWRAVARLPSNPEENAITKALVEALDVDGVARRRFYCDYQFVPIEWGPKGEATEDQYIDMAMIVSNNRRTYLAYECKKLSVPHKDGTRRSQAGAYVEDGMMRFVTEKYAKDLPIGCMLGYVMDGDMDFAHASINTAVVLRKLALGLQGQPRDVSPIGVTRRFVTKHVCNTRWMEMRHALLPFVDTDV